MSCYSVTVNMSAKIKYHLTADGRAFAHVSVAVGDGEPCRMSDIDLTDIIDLGEPPTRFELYQCLKNIEADGAEVQFDWSPSPLLDASLRGLIG